MKERGHSYVFIPDGDEIPEPKLIGKLLDLAKVGASHAVRVTMETYFKSPRYVIRPREELRPILLLNVQTTQHHYIREFQTPDSLVLGPEFGLLHHISYGGPDERIQRKISTWGHKHEVVASWWENVWKRWDLDPNAIRDFHPTHPPCYGHTERVEIPEVLQGIFDPLEPKVDPPLPKRWPKISVIIPLYGGPLELRANLESLATCKDLLHEVIVVDDQSPDEAATVAREFEFVDLLTNEKNLGFGPTCNAGYEKSTGEAVIFLNSDTVVTRAALVRLIETLWSSGTIGAAGPYSNNAGYFQYLVPAPHYNGLDGLRLFAQDFACREFADLNVNMLVGFCLACRRSAIEEVGNVPFDPRFETGMWEDTDLCYRLQRKGYRLKVSARSYVQHIGGASLARQPIHSTALLAKNRKVFYDKWRRDLETGFASHLAGHNEQPIVFQADRAPERLEEEVRAKAKRASISACIIAKNEERVIGDMLASIKAFFPEIIVVDTGSSDRTVEIAEEHGAKVFHFPWCDSFSAARNESLRHATGDWIFLCDADDTLPWECGDKLLDLVLNAPDQDVAYTVAVQFVDRQGTGARVDHVKLFRNHVGAEFIFRIHENVLPSLRETGLSVVQTGLYVLHSGQDTSPATQARKRDLHYRLLEMDLKEQGEHSFILFNLGMTDYFNGLPERAVDWLRRSIAAGDPGESQTRKTYSLLCASLLKLNRAEEAAEVARRGLSLIPDDPEIRSNLGTALITLGRFEEAREQFHLIRAEAIAGHFSSLDPVIFGAHREHRLAECCLGLKDYAGARAHWLKAIQSRPLYVESVLGLWTKASEAADFATLRKVMEEVEHGTGHSDLWVTLLCSYSQMLEGEAGPEMALQRTAQADPHAHSVRIELCRRLLAQGRQDECIQHLRFLSDNGVAFGSSALSQIAMSRGQFELAEQFMASAQALNPEEPHYTEQLQNLRRLLADQKVGAA